VSSSSTVGEKPITTTKGLRRSNQNLIGHSSVCCDIHLSKTFDSKISKLELKSLVNFGKNDSKKQSNVVWPHHAQGKHLKNLIANGKYFNINRECSGWDIWFFRYK
jgi:hypothetical protein